MIKRLICWMFHEEYHVATPVYHSWDYKCMKCGREWTVHD